MTEKHSAITSVLIVGGGSAGWMSAALLARVFKGRLAISLVESSEVGTIGVGEASIPPLTLFNQGLGIDEAEFLRHTQGSIKLGIEFQGWGDKNSCYMHAFGAMGKDLGLIPFHQLWLKRFLGSGDTGNSANPANDFWRYSLNSQAAKANRFAPMAQINGTPLSGLTHAYHFDAGLYGAFLKDYSTARGVTHIDGHIASVDLEHSHHERRIASVSLTSGEVLSADFYIDCSGMKALLIEEALGAGFDDYSALLPCNRAIAVPSERTEPLTPYTQSIAFEAGWRWRIPLNHRTGNGVVYSSEFMSDDEAETKLLEGLDGKPLGEPRRIRFTTGRRKQQWAGNCVAIGLSSGFLEPLESTSIHLVQSALLQLVRFFPASSDFKACRDGFNRASQQEFEEIRDFILLHYVLNRRDEPFWRARAAVALPESLASRMALFAENGSLERHSDELFSALAWQQVLLGQGLVPITHAPIADTVPGAELAEYLENIHKIQQRALSSLPLHSEFLAKLSR
ncbi:tryptophan 7-halogenase [Shewanella sp. 3B26]|uniref:Tryptophan 7-halogenase n=1 Tax=Shewanella zhuhaiensis TaxID=2919576 RepID=A0AAJ1BKP8_9GAMM|nr:tryptophan halogenase family protein [Shewanella zhuhaiensis]MCH4296664.1 tryptophan 7-halogenase [Shewanella zhuhaiensis]